MKTPKELVESINLNGANLEHIAKTGKINGLLLVEIVLILEEYGKQEYDRGKKDGIEIGIHGTTMWQE